MKRIRIGRPSPALAISCIALFASLGGVSYGLATGSIDSREIADNTIRSKDIRDNSVYSRDLRNNDIRSVDIRNGTIHGRDVARRTLTGDHIDMRKLGPVPEADRAADTAALGGQPASAYSRSAEPVRFVGEPGAPFAPGVAAAPPPALAPGFWIDGDGVVTLQGTVAGPAGVLLTLPAGYRPAGTARFAVVDGGGAGTLTVDPDGTVTAAGPNASLDGVSFRAAP